MIDIHTDLLGERIEWTIQYSHLPYDVIRVGTIRGVTNSNVIIEYDYKGENRLGLVYMQDIVLIPKEKLFLYRRTAMRFRLDQTVTFGHLEEDGTIGGDHKNVPRGTVVEAIGEKKGQFLLEHEGRHAYQYLSVLTRVLS